MYIRFKRGNVSISCVEKSKYRIRRDINNIIDYKSIGAGLFARCDYATLIGKELHVIDFIKRN